MIELLKLLLEARRVHYTAINRRPTDLCISHVLVQPRKMSMNIQPLSCLDLRKNELEERAHRAGLEMHSRSLAVLPGSAFVENSHGNRKVTTNIPQSDLFSPPLGRKIFQCLIEIAYFPLQKTNARRWKT